MQDERDPGPPLLGAHAPRKRRSMLTPEDEAFLVEAAPLWEDAPSGQAPSFESCVDVQLESEALRFAHSFMRSDEQEWPQRLAFMQRMDLVSSSTSIGTGTSRGSSLTIAVVKFLIAWTASQNADEREKAIKSIVVLSKKLFCYSCSKGDVPDFPLTGQLLGCFLLCCTDPREAVARSALEGLCLLHSFLTCQKGEALAKEGGLILTEWDQEDNFLSDPLDVTLFSDPLDVTQVFARHLRPGELTNCIIAAIKGMRDDSAHSTKAGVSMLRIILQDPSVALGKVSKAVVAIHHNLDSISNPVARQETLRTLRVLGRSYMNKVVNALLLCSLECDSTAAEMWNALVRFSLWASKALRNLLACLQGRPLGQSVSPAEAVLFPVAATAALEQILQNPLPAFREEVKLAWEKLGLVLLVWVSRTFHLRPWERESIRSHVRGRAAPSPPDLTRSAVSALRKVVQCAGCGNESLLMKRLTVWEMLSAEETFHQGAAFFVRTVARTPPHELRWMLEYAMALLDDPNEACVLTAMTVFVELLQISDLGVVPDEDIVSHLSRQLSSSRAVLRSLALEGILHLVDNPKRVLKLHHFLPEILQRLQESDRETSLKALRLVKHLVHNLEGTRCVPLALEVAAQVLPLFDDESHKVRSLAVCLFGTLLQNTARKSKGPLKEQVVRSLVPLAMHLHDQSPVVAQACWDTLSAAARFLNCHELQHHVQSQDGGSICLLLVKHYRRDPSSRLLSQSMKYLKSPQASIREAAIRLTGLAAQETRSRRKLEALCRVLGDLKDDPKLSVSLLAVQTMQALEALQERIPSGCGLRLVLRRVWRSCTW